MPRSRNGVRASTSPRSTTATRSRPRCGGPRSTAPRKRSSGRPAAPAHLAGGSGSRSPTRSLDAAAALVLATWLGLWGGPGSLAWRRWLSSGWPGCGSCNRTGSPGSSSVPVRDWWRWWFYRRRWQAAMTLAGLAPDYRGRRSWCPVLGKVHRGGSVDLVRVGLVTGQAPADFADKTENLAHAFGARLCRVRDIAPGRCCWSSSAPTLSPNQSPRCRSPERWTWPGCRWAGARTARRGCCACSAPTC
jgi:hypothetical protein